MFLDYIAILYRGVWKINEAGTDRKGDVLFIKGTDGAESWEDG